MNWQALAVLQTIPAASQLLMMRHVARGRRKYNAFVLNVISVLMLFVCGLVAFPFLGVKDASRVLHYSGYLLFGGVGFMCATAFMYKALEHLAAGIFSILQTMSTLFTLVLAWLILGETFQHYQWVGASILMVTIWATLWLANREDPHLEKSANWKTGVFYSVLSALFSAFALINEKYLLGHMAIGTYMIFGWGTQALVACATIGLFAKRKDFQNIFKNRQSFYWITGSGVMRGLAAVCFVFAQVYSNNIALVSVISNFKIILIGVFGAIILKEHKFFVHKMATASMAVTGLALTLRR